jgi:phosphate transport system permease protein
VTSTGTPSTSTRKGPSAPAARQRGDRVFAGTAQGAGILILVALAGAATFLLWKAFPALTAPAAELPGGKSLAAYIGPPVFGTLLSAVLALVLATPHSFEGQS